MAVGLAETRIRILEFVYVECPTGPLQPMALLGAGVRKCALWGTCYRVLSS